MRTFTILALKAQRGVSASTPVSHPRFHVEKEMEEKYTPSFFEHYSIEKILIFYSAFSRNSYLEYQLHFQNS